MGREPRTALDALHAELLGSLVEIEKSAARLDTSLPQVKQEVEGLVAGVHAAFSEFKESSIALVGYIKARQLDTLGALEGSQERVITANQKSLAGFDRTLWLLCGMTGVNSILLIALLLARARPH